jgi:hypothetical protein
MREAVFTEKNERDQQLKHLKPSQNIIKVCILSRPKLKFNQYTHLWHKSIDVLVANQPLLKYQYGIHLSFKDAYPLKKTYDIIIILSRFTARMSKEEKIAFLKEVRPKAGRLLWFSERDSAGFTEFEVLPYVDQYLCKHIYKDLEDYNKAYYFNRKYVDYYAKLLNFEKEVFEINEPLRRYEEYQHKIGLWWNIAYNNVGMIPRWQWLMNTYLLHTNPSFSKPVISNSASNRDIQLHALFIIKEQRGHVNIQRQLSLQKLKELDRINMPPISKRISLRKYVNYLKRSQCVYSPFGWGEICYRDFAGFLAGSCLIKPDVSDIHTWPDVLKAHETYVPIQWNLEDLEEKLDYFLTNHEEREQIALNGYQKYIALWEGEGIQRLLDRFHMILTNPDSSLW